jgi:hypothetical protein
MVKKAKDIKIGDRIINRHLGKIRVYEALGRPLPHDGGEVKIWCRIDDSFGEGWMTYLADWEVEIQD